MKIIYQHSGLSQVRIEVVEVKLSIVSYKSYSDGALLLALLLWQVVQHSRYVRCQGLKVRTVNLSFFGISTSKVTG